MQIDHLFVVYDPTSEAQLALDRAAVIAGNEGSKVHLYACIHDDTSPSDGQSAGVSALEVKLEQAAAPLREKGIEVDIEVEWEKDWYSAVVSAANRSGAGAVLKSSQRHSKGSRRLKKSSDWTLIRECKCPVLLVKTNATLEPRKVVAALDIRGGEEKYGKLNENILTFCQRYIGSDSADVHFVSAHKDLADRPDRGTLLRTCGVDSDKVHIKLGDPDDVIVESAVSLGGNLVVIGNSARSGLSALVKSNTAEKVLDELQCDLLALT